MNLAYGTAGLLGRSMCWMALTRKTNRFFSEMPCFGNSQLDKCVLFQFHTILTSQTRDLFTPLSGFFAFYGDDR